jgi:hypothetical protein
MQRAWLWTLGALLAVLAACGGGGGSPVPSAAQSPAAIATGAARVSLTITIPPKGAAPLAKRRPAYVTSSVQGVKILAVPYVSPSPSPEPSGIITPGPSQSGGVFYALTPQSTYCTGGGAQPLVCTLALQAPPGTDLFTVTTYDTPDLSGNEVSTGVTVATVAAGASTNVSIAASPIPYGLVSTPHFTAGTAGTGQAQCCLDADGNTITGPLAAPVQLKTDDTTGGLSLTPATVTAAGNVSVAYNGTATTATSDIEVANCALPVCTFGSVTIDVPSQSLYVGAVGTSPAVAVAPGGSSIIRTLSSVSYGVTVNASGAVYTSGGTTVASFGDGVSTTSPDALVVQAISGANTTFAASISDVTFALNTVYVANNAANSIVGFSAGYVGNISPNVSIAGASTQLSAPTGLAVDANADLWVAQSAEILEFISGASGNVAPLAAITGFNTGLNGAQGVAVDSSGTIYVTDNTSGGAGQVEIFASGSTGNVAPARTITGAATGLGSNPIGIAVDTSGNIYVADTANNRIAVFAAGASGNVAPARVIPLSFPPAYLALRP